MRKVGKIYWLSILMALFVACVLFYGLNFQEESIDHIYSFSSNLNGKSEVLVSKDFNSSVNAFVLKFGKNKPNNIEYRYESNGNVSEPNHIEIDYDLGGNDVFSKIHFVGKMDKIWLHFEESKELKFDEIELYTYGNERTGIAFAGKFKDRVFASSNEPEIISRKEWGANETLRYYDENNPPPIVSKFVEADLEWIEEFADEIRIVKSVDIDPNSKKKLIWPLEYTENVEKVIIHHSAGRSPSCSEEEEFLKSIYRFHTVTRGWGDIGYNYVVGPCSGKIYEGRAGGFAVKGAHAGKFNAKTIGIMVMGNFENDEVRPIVIDTLVDLVKYLGEKYGFWPNGSSKIRGLNLPNVVGHKDVGNTSCPGGNLYSELSKVRTRASDGFVFPSKPYRTSGDYSDVVSPSRKESFSARPLMAGANQIFLQPGREEEVTIMFKNMGSRMWNDKTYIKVDGDSNGLTFNTKLGGSQIAKMKESTVAPMKVGTFKVKIRAGDGLRSKEYKFNFLPVINGIYKSTEGEYKFIVIILGDEKNTSRVDTSEEGIENIILDDLSDSSGLKMDEVKEAIQSTENLISKQQESPIFYKDVDTKNPFYSYIEDLKKSGIMSGQSGYFAPKRELTRGEFAKILVVSKGLTLKETKRSYADIAGTTFEKFIRTLQSNGVISGEKANFDPFRYITRAEVIKMVVNTFGLDGTTSYRYVDMRGNQFEEYVLKALANGIIRQNQFFHPNAPITREEVTKIIALAREKSGISKVVSKQGTSQSVSSVATKTESNKEETVSAIPERTNESMGPQVRLDLNFVDSYYEVTSDDLFAVYDNEKLLKGGLKAGEVVSVLRTSNGMQVNIAGEMIDRNGPIKFVPSNGKIMELKNQNRLGKTPAYNRYRGGIELRVDPDVTSKMYAVNILPLEEYLYGLAEEPGNEPPEKIKTVIVMARSYIEYYRKHGGKFPDRKVDLKSDGGTSQYYLGYDFEIRHEAVKKIVDLTRGEVITYNGEAIRAPYFSKSGGHTFTPGTEGNTWSAKSFPFALRGEDPWSCGKDLNYIKENGPVTCPSELRGHGVGLSAFGARKMAEDGKGYKEIIKYFLTGVEFQKIY